VTDDSPAPKRRPHRRTGRPLGSRSDNTNALHHGLRSAEFVAHRKQIAQLIREARALIRQ
jgi:hypothetical protein